MSEILYRKVGRRYQPVGIEWSGWPANGIWIVQEATQRLISRIGDIPDPTPLAALEQHRDAIGNAIIRMRIKERQGVALSANDFVNEIFLEIIRHQDESLR